MEKDLEIWIHHTWQRKGKLDLSLGPKVLFIVIFSNIEDKA